LVYFLKTVHPKGVDYRHSYVDDDGWYYVAHQAASWISRDHYRIDNEGGYLSDIMIEQEQDGMIYIASIYDGKPDLIVSTTEDAIEKMFNDESFWWR